jgi:uncharacterized protein
MAGQIVILVNGARFQAELNDTATAEAILQALPIEARANRWGDEIYFSIPVTAELESGAREVLQAGELGYWPPGRAFCIFFGSTPAAQAGEIRAASPVNVIGRIEAEPAQLRKVPDGAEVSLQRGSERG